MSDSKQSVSVGFGLGTFFYMVGLVVNTGGWFWLSLLLPPFGVYFGVEHVLKSLGWL